MPGLRTLHIGRRGWRRRHFLLYRIGKGQIFEIGHILHDQMDFVERTIAWLNRCRRLAKDWENLNRKALAFLRLASIRLMLRKLCNPA
jgi:transposase